VSKLPDVQQLLSQQADLMSGAQAAGQVVAQAIGTYASMKKAQADAAAKAAWDAGDIDAYNAAVAESKSWAEGGSNRIALHIAGGALLGGLGGGSIGTALQGAAGAGLSSALATQLDSLSNGIADSTGSTLLGSLVSNMVAGAGGALVGGGTGAFTAANADLYNRQLHPDERKLAKDIAEKSNGQYTQAQVEEQLRLMGMCEVGGGCVSPGVAEELNGRTPTDPGAQWINTGLINANGNPLIVQSLPAPNQALQTFIMENYNSATPGQIPSGFDYVSTPVGPDVRGTVASMAGGVSTAAGRFSAATIAAAQIPSPYSPGLIAASYAGTATGLVADAIAQMAKPDVGQYAVSGVTGVIVGGLSDRIPGLSPAFNETANVFNNSNAAQKAQDSLNSYWKSFIDYWSPKR
jgi:filamentous hemagglutinin